jgi:hypothetical protein
MAQPSPIFVTPSTTLVQVTTLQSPYIPVLLNSYNYQGQVVSILDSTSSFDILYSSIVVSTTAGNTFGDGSISTLINQPQGFLTLQSQSPNLWKTLNSFPFRDQYTSAGLYTVTTSNYRTATLSTIDQYTNTLNVEEIIVSGNFIQSSPIVLNQTVSSLGSVDLYSSIKVFESAFFSSGLSTIGAVSFFSSLTVDGNVTVLSSLRFLSTLFVSGSVSVVDSVSAGLVSLSSGLITNSLIITQSTIDSVDSGGGLFVGNTLTALSSVNIGGDFTAKSLIGINSFSTLSSLAIGGDTVISGTLEINKNLSTTGPLSVVGHLSTGDITILGNLQATSLNVEGFMELQGSLFTQTLQGFALVVEENMTVNDSEVVTVGSMDVSSFFTVQSISTQSTFIGGLLSTTASASLAGTILGEANLSSLGAVSTILLTTLAEFATDSLSSLGSLFQSGNLDVEENLTVVQTSFWNLSGGQTSLIYNDLNIQGDLYVNSTLTINSITLPENVFGNDFFVSSLVVGDIGIVETAKLVTLEASTVGTGGIVYPAFTMDMLNRLETENLSTFLLSTNLFLANGQGADTSFHITSSLGVGLTASTNTFMVNPIAYTKNTLYALSSISTLRVIGGNFNALFEGDGSLLSNTFYPAEVHICTLNLTSTLTSELLIGSTFFASTGLVSLEFNPTSTMTIGSLSIFGNYYSPDSCNEPGSLSKGPFIAPYGANTLFLNPLEVYGTNFTFDVTNRGAIINCNLLALDPIYDQNDIYTLRVGGTMRVDSIAPDITQFYQLQANDLYIDGIFLNASNQPSSIAFVNTGETTLSSGRLSISSILTFLPEGEDDSSYKKNIIQPIQSTLAFNSTLYVNRLTSSIGIQNLHPNFTVDVNGTTYAPSSFYTYTSSVINDKIKRTLPNENVWFATSPLYQNFVAYSTDDGDTWSGITSPNTFTLYNIASDGGGQYVANSNYSIMNTYEESRWVAVGQYFAFGNMGVYSSPNPLSGSWTPGSVTFIQQQFYPGQFALQAFTNVAYNGSYWLMTAFNNANSFFAFFGLNFQRQTIFRSSDGQNWTPATSGGFRTDDFRFSGGGGRAMAFSGTEWVVVGLGSNPINCIQYSTDGSNWDDANLGFFVNPNPFGEALGGFDVVWTGKNFVAAGYTAVSPNIIYSSDGISWTNAQGEGLESFATCVAWNGSRLVAGGPTSNTVGLLYSDNHGSNWLSCSGDTISVDEKIVWNGKYWLATGSAGVSKSIDGIVWTYSSLGNDFFTSLAYNSNITPSLAVGDSVLRTFSNRVVSDNPLNVAVGVDITTSGLTTYTSPNGIDWQLATGDTITDTGNSVAFGRSRWVAGGVGFNNLVYSDTGFLWNPVSFISGGGHDIASVFYTNGLWLAGTIFDPSRAFLPIYRSSDGAVWTTAQLSNFFCNESVLGFAEGLITAGSFTGYRYFCVGKANTGVANAGVSEDGQLWGAYFSFNAINFFPSNLTIFAIIYDGDKWICGGESGAGPTSLIYSTDGFLWTNGSFGAESDFFQARALAYNGSNLYVAVGQTNPGATIKWSIDGRIWTNALSGAFTNLGFSVTYNAVLDLWIAGGDLNSLKYSSDGKNWTNSSYTGGTVFGVANAATATLTVLPYYSQFRLYNDPLPNVVNQTITPYISYTSTSMDLNSMIFFDKEQNVVFYTNNEVSYGSNGSNSSNTSNSSNGFNIDSNNLFYNPFSTSSFINYGYTNIREGISSIQLFTPVLTLGSRTV